MAFMRAPRRSATTCRVAAESRSAGSHEKKLGTAIAIRTVATPIATRSSKTVKPLSALLCLFIRTSQFGSLLFIKERDQAESGQEKAKRDISGYHHGITLGGGQKVRAKKIVSPVQTKEIGGQKRPPDLMDQHKKGDQPDVESHLPRWNRQLDQPEFIDNTHNLTSEARRWRTISPLRALLHRHGLDLLVIRPSLDGLHHPVLHQGGHPLLHDNLLYLSHRGVCLDEVLDLIGGNQKFVKPNPALVSGLVAGIAAFASIEKKAIAVLDT